MTDIVKGMASRPIRIGQLATINADPYFGEMPDTEWFVQVWDTSPEGRDFIMARFYGASPDEARDRAKAFVESAAAIRAAAGEEGK